MAVVLAIDNARGRVNQKCVDCPVSYWTITLAYMFIVILKESQFTRDCRSTAFSCELIRITEIVEEFFLVLT
jgi:hypothetical protein